MLPMGLSEGKIMVSDTVSQNRPLKTVKFDVGKFKKN